MPLRMAIDEKDRRHQHVLSTGEIVVGSSVDCDIQLSHPTVSRRHALILVGGSEAWLEDLDSSNGTRLDGTTVRERRPLLPGARIQFGDVRASIEEIAPDDLVEAISFSSSKQRLADTAHRVGARETAAPAPGTGWDGSGSRDRGVREGAGEDLRLLAGLGTMMKKLEGIFVIPLQGMDPSLFPYPG